MRKRLCLMRAGCLWVVALAACSNDETEVTAPNPNVPVVRTALRIVHAVPDAPNVDVRVDTVTVWRNVPFTGVSGYLDVSPGDVRIVMNETGTTTEVMAALPLITVTQSYTILATGYLSDIRPLVVFDNRSAPPAGQVKIRVVHAAPAIGNVDVYATAPSADLATATPVFTNVPIRGFSDYLTLPAGTYRLRVVDAGTKTPVAIDATVAFAAGQVRTIVARDNVGGGAPLNVILLHDRN